MLAVVEQLQGFELAAGAWEKAILAARVTGYRREWLDEVCLYGGVAWGRLSVRDDPVEADAGRPPAQRADAVPGHADHADHPGRSALAAARGPRRPPRPPNPGPAGTADVLDALRQRGALFPHDLASADRPAARRGRGGAVGRRGPRPDHRGRLPRGPVAVRPPGGGAGHRVHVHTAPAPPRQPARRSARRTTARAAGRWSLLPEPAADCDPDDLAEAVAEQLAARWGVVFRDLLARENLAVPWREVLWALRRMEARGTVARRPVRARVQRRAVRAPGRGRPCCAK